MKKTKKTKNKQSDQKVMNGKSILKRFRFNKPSSGL